jgi:hypothetical protein
MSKRGHVHGFEASCRGEEFLDILDPAFRLTRLVREQKK